jgi:hypothetical protein
MALETPIPHSPAPLDRAESVAPSPPRQGPALASLLRHRLGAWGAAGLLLAIVSAAVTLGWNAPRQQQTEALARSLADSEAGRLQRLRAVAAEGVSPAAESGPAAAHRVWQALPLQAQRHADLQGLTAAVSEARLVLERADLRPLGDSGPLLQEEWQLRLWGPYPQQRLLLQALRDRLPNAALQALALDREDSRAEVAQDGAADAPAPENVRLQLTLRLHYRSPEAQR